MGLHPDNNSNRPSYAQWIRSVMTRSDSRAMPLIGSSFAEPVRLLAQTIESGLQGGLPSTYQSVFVNGNPRLKHLLSRQYEVSTDRILCTTGASRALSLIYGAFARPGQRVLIERPAHDLFEVLARDRGLIVDHLLRRPEDDFDVTPESFLEALSGDTRIVVLSNLHNPSGCLLTDRRLEELSLIAARRDTLVIVDEVYLGYADAARGAACATNIADNLISINSLTKTHGLSSLRCGWIIAAEPIMEVLRDYSDQHEFGVSKLSHAVAALVLEEEENYARYRRELIGRVKPIFDHYLGQLVEKNLIGPALPDFGCVYFPVFTEIADSGAFCRWLEKEKRVIVAPGEYFGYPGAVRVGMPEQVELLEKALEGFVTGVVEYSDRAV